MVLACIASAVLWHFGSWWCWLPLSLMMPVGILNKCPVMCSSSPVTQYQVVTSGFSNSATPTCTDCESYNATWTITEIDCATAPGLTTACYCARFQINPCLCRQDDAFNPDGGHDERYAVNRLEFGIFETGEINATFAYNTSAGSPPADCHTIDTVLSGLIGVRWVISTGSQPCGTFSSQAMTRSLINIGCDHDSSDALITAI